MISDSNVESTEKLPQAERQLLDTFRFHQKLVQEAKGITPQSNLGVIAAHDPEGLSESRASALLQATHPDDIAGNIGGFGVISTHPPEEVVRTALRLKQTLPNISVGVKIFDPRVDVLETEGVAGRLLREAERAKIESGRQGGKVEVFCRPTKLNDLTAEEKKQIILTHR